MNRRLTACQSAILCIIASLTTLGCRSGASTTSADPVSGFYSSATTHTGATRVSFTGAQRVAINDPQFGMTAITLDIPTGWKFVGQIVNPPGCHSVPDSADMTALGQDGVTAVIVLPMVQWTVTPGNNRISQGNAQKCPPVNITTASDFLVKIAIPNMHPGAKVEDLLPDENPAGLAKQLEQIRQQNATAGPLLRTTDQTLDGARPRGVRPQRSARGGND
ncbi:MAG: hypothetical protein WB439_17835 [Acidobacteriaceae bacterium]